MNLREFEDQACTKCGGTRVDLRYCEGTCIPDIQPRFVDVRSNGDPLIPHLHVTCACCDHEWLVKPMEDSERGRIDPSCRANATLDESEIITLLSRPLPWRKVTGTSS